MKSRLVRRLSTIMAVVAVTMILLAGVASNVSDGAAVGPNPIDRAGTLPTNGRLVFQNPRGMHRYYAFFLSQSSNWVYSYSVDGFVWSPAQTAISGGTGSASIWVYDLGPQLILHFVGNGLQSSGSILYRRGTIPDNAETITWTAVQTIESGGSFARTFGLSITRTENGLPVVTAVAEVYTNPR